MATNYPASIDTTISLPTVIDNLTPVVGAVANRLRDAILAIEGELGVKPSGIYTTVRNRLDTLESIIASLQQSESGGLIVVGTPQIGQTVVWSGAAWIPSTNFAAQNIVTSGSVQTTFLKMPDLAIVPPVSSPNQGTMYFDQSQESFLISQNGGPYLPILTGTGYEITLLGPMFAEVGDIVFNPLFSASYNKTPTTAVFVDNVGNPSENVLTAPSPSTPNLFFYNQQYQFNTYGSSVVFTLTSTNGTSTATAINTLTWTQNIYFGASAIPGSYTSGFVRSLVGSFLGTARQTTFTVNAGTNQAIFYAYRSAYGLADFWVDGWEGGFSLVATVAVTNSNGFTENYNVYQSDQVNLGLTTVNVF